MWLTFGITALISFFWLGKMVIGKEFKIQRTPLDIPILLFLLSQVISTIFSLDVHTSIWGYYSRFNGGLLSTIAYIILYYAFVSNFAPQIVSASNKNKLTLKNLWDQVVVKRMLLVSLASGVFVALWGLPSHFGYDPTCLVFRGHLDVACWTTDFQPKVRIFSTLGQPDWMAAYLDILLPISLAFCLNFFKRAEKLTSKSSLTSLLFAAISVLFYVDLLFTRAKSGFIGFWGSFIIFAAFIIWRQYKNNKSKSKVIEIVKSKIIVLTVLFLIITFFIGTGITGVDKFSFDGIRAHFSKQAAVQVSKQTQALIASPGELGGTDSGTIRLIVWKGALDAWKNNPIFGTGVETFAFAYYKYRPAAHNMTSEWNFLYNKAHNEYLNYMATTGTFGIVTYMSILLLFLLIVAGAVFPKINKASSPLLQRLKVKDYPYFEENSVLIAAITASFISILITDFFGFSVVITNIYLFLLPVFAFILLGVINPTYIVGRVNSASTNTISKIQFILIIILVLPTAYIMYFLINSWRADNEYAYGLNLDGVGQYQQAYPYLHNAVAMRPDEPVFKNEMAVNDATLATLLVSQATGANQQQNQAIAQSLAQEAISTSNDLTTSYPNNIIYWKSKVRIYYSLAQVNAQYLPLALAAIQKAAVLAPTDATISYNLGVLTGQSGDSKGAVKVLENTVKLKPDYTDAYYALGLFYRDLAVDKTGKIVVNKAYETKAEDTMNYILTHLDPNYAQAKASLAAWTGK